MRLLGKIRMPHTTKVKGNRVEVIASGGLGDQLRIYWELRQRYPDKTIHMSVSKDRIDTYSNEYKVKKWQTPNTKSNFIEELPLLFPNLVFDKPAGMSTGLIKNANKIDVIQEYLRDNIKPIHDLPENFVFVNLDCSNRFNPEHNPNPWLKTRKYTIEEELTMHEYIKSLGYNVVSSKDRFFSILELPYVFEKSKYTIMVDSFNAILSLGLAQEHRNKMIVINKDLEGVHPVLNSSLALYRKFGVTCIFNVDKNFETISLKTCI